MKSGTTGAGTRAIWWIRRDLRLSDNNALQSAIETFSEIIPVFILDEKLLTSNYTGEKRIAFLFAGLQQLDESLRARGSRLLLRSGDPIIELGRLLAESGAQAIFAEPDYSPYAIRRDERAARLLPIQWCGSPVVHPPGSLVKSNGEPYVVFTPFSRAWKSLPRSFSPALEQAPSRITTPADLLSQPVPDLPALMEAIPFRPGEAEAWRRLKAFTSGEVIYDYRVGRDRVDLEATSQLSPYLRFGMLSARQAVAAADTAQQEAPDEDSRYGAETWLNELVWREFYTHILYHFPQVRRQNFRLPSIAWANDTTLFTAWCKGSTGYPFIDAAMRQLVTCGWMHNRARMVVASFLTKDLLIDWRWGERFFMQHLIDGDPAANNGGWQWTAGTGTDAAPYFRIFNPVSQSKKHDPEGRFLRRWLPELSSVPQEYIHTPWEMPEEVQKTARCQIGHDYPLPIIDHHWARERALQTYAKSN